VRQVRLILKKSSFLSAIVLTLSLLLVLFYSENISQDYNSYLIFYNDIREFDGLLESLYYFRFEPGFLSLSYFLSLLPFLSGKSYFLLLATASLVIKYRLFKKYLNFPNFAWFIYILLFIPALEASQIRTAIAMVLVLYFILKTNNRGLIASAMLATLFHYSGVIIILLSAHKRLITAISAIIIFAVLFLFIENIFLFLHTDVMPLKQFISGSSKNYVNLLSTLLISQFLISLFGILDWHNLNQSQKKGLFLILIGSVFYLVLYDNPGIAHRIREISLLGIFPLVFSGDIKRTKFFWIISSLIYYIVSYSFIHTLLRLYDFYL